MISIFKLIHRVYSKIFSVIRYPIKMGANYRKNADIMLSHITLPSAGNAGDTALSTAVRDLFNEKLGSVSWKLQNVLLKITDKTIERLNNSDAIVIGGHGLFIPDTNANCISNWEFPCSEQQYDEIAKPIIVFAVGYNYFRGQERTELFESNIRKLVEKSAFFGLRNKGSVKEICSFLDDDLKKKVRYQPCPTMVARYIYPDLPPKRKTGKIAFNVALDRTKLRMGDNKDVILDQIANAMYQLKLKGYKIYFITHLCAEIPFLQYIKKYRFDYKFYDASTWDIKSLTSFYNEMDVVVGMRGHGIWIPFGVNCQIISLGNQNKTKWFLEDIDALDWFIDINVQPEKLSQTIINKFVDIYESNYEETNRRLLEAQCQLWKVTCDNMEIIKKILHNR